jgi:hypothetical protein
MDSILSCQAFCLFSVGFHVFSQGPCIGVHFLSHGQQEFQHLL